MSGGFPVRESTIESRQGILRVDKTWINGDSSPLNAKLNQYSFPGGNGAGFFTTNYSH